MKYTYAFRNLGGNCINMHFPCDIFINELSINIFINFYLLNILPFCIGIISWCCFIVPLFRCTSHVPLFSSIPIIPIISVFRYSTSAPVFLWCSVFRNSVFRCFWFYSMPEISAFVRVTVISSSAYKWLRLRLNFFSVA